MGLIPSDFGLVRYDGNPHLKPRLHRLALARKPRCLVADEPLAGIEPWDQEALVGVLKGLAERGCAILVTGHDVNPLMALADDIIWMVGGTTHWLGSPESARAHYQFRREYLGPRGYRSG